MAEHYVEITITAPIPEGKKTLGYKAIVETEAAADAIVKKLHDMGLTGATQARDIRKRKPWWTGRRCWTRADFTRGPTERANARRSGRPKTPARSPDEDTDDDDAARP
jgi:hypothetical protein